VTLWVDSFGNEEAAWENIALVLNMKELITDTIYNGATDPTDVHNNLL